MKRDRTRCIAFWLSGSIAFMGSSIVYDPIQNVSASETVPAETRTMEAVPMEAETMEAAPAGTEAMEVAPVETGSAEAVFETGDEDGKGVFQVVLPTEQNVSASGTASVATAPEATHREDVFQAVLSTDTEHIFDFIMDPQSLISKTDAAAYGDCIFEEGATLFFRRHDEGCEEDYSSSSDALVITNKGTAEVDIVLTASISLDPMSGVTITDDSGFTDDMDASLYLALTDGEDTVPVDPEEEVSLHAILEGVTGSEGDDACNEYRFWLTGAVNENGDWSEVEDAAPKVTVTWSVTREEPEDQEGEGYIDESQEEKRAEQPGSDEEKKEAMVPEEDAGQEGQSPSGAEESLEDNGSQDEPELPEKDEKDTGGQSATEAEENSEDQNIIGEDGDNEDQNVAGTEGGCGDQDVTEEEGDRRGQDVTGETGANSGDQDMTGVEGSREEHNVTGTEENSGPQDVGGDGDSKTQNVGGTDGNSKIPDVTGMEENSGAQSTTGTDEDSEEQERA